MRSPPSNITQYDFTVWQGNLVQPRKQKQNKITSLRWKDRTDWLNCLLQIILVIKGHWDKNQILLSRSSINQQLELKNNAKTTQPVPCLCLPWVLWAENSRVVVLDMEIQQQWPDWQELLHVLVWQSTTCKFIFWVWWGEWAETPKC